MDKNEYCCLADCFYSSKKIDIFAYIMGPDSSKDKLIKIISDYSGLSVQSITQSKFSFKKNESIQEWLQNFYKSKFVVIDSFHGLAFSLIFNKPFIVCGFSNRGMGRYESLLRYFSLENRLLYSLEDLKELNLSTIWDINWKEVNAKIAENKRFVLELMQTVGV
ncbi:polysaccharide pyruvyl transferase family protein [Bacteroides fragilis]|nr:polysaccharide pyruvyl transferase family protein [Bacteroides fragilis]